MGKDYKKIARALKADKAHMRETYQRCKEMIEQAWAVMTQLDGHYLYRLVT